MVVKSCSCLKCTLKLKKVPRHSYANLLKNCVSAGCFSLKILRNNLHTRYENLNNHFTINVFFSHSISKKRKIPCQIIVMYAYISNKRTDGLNAYVRINFALTDVQ